MGCWEGNRPGPNRHQKSSWRPPAGGSGRWRRVRLQQRPSSRGWGVGARSGAPSLVFVPNRQADRAGPYTPAFGARIMRSTLVGY